MNPVLYLIMRNDIPSMNPGKLAAQAAHVANQFVFDLHANQKSNQSVLDELYRAWVDMKENRAFGTTITLAAPKVWFNGGAFNIPYALYAEVNDPTYPCAIPQEVAEYLYSFVDKNIVVASDTGVVKPVFLRDELVGAYLFGDKDDPSVQYALRDLELYP